MIPLWIASLGLVVFERDALAEDVQIEGIDVLGGERVQVLITMEETAEGSAVSSYSTSDPSQVVIDLMDARVPEDIGEIMGDGELISRVEILTFDDGQGIFTRIRLYLLQPIDRVEHSLKTEGNVVRVTLSVEAAEDDPLAAALEEAEEDPLAAALEEASADEVVAEEDLEELIEEDFVVEELLEEDLEPIDSQLDPLEEDFELEGFVEGDLEAEEFVVEQPIEDDPLSEALEAADTGEGLEDDPLAAALAASEDGSGEHAAFIDTETGPRKLSGPETLPGGASVSSLDFQMVDDAARVIVGLQGTRDFTVSQPQSNMVVVDIPNVFLPQSLNNRGDTSGGRVLDTSRFIRFGSPVRLVRAYRTSTGARVAMTLSRSAEHRVEIGEDGLIFVEIPLTAEEQDRWLNRGGEATAEVSPQESEGGIENAYRKEVLIGKGGRTIDPQVAFGTGGGSGSSDMLPGMAGGFITEVSGASAQSYMGERINLDFMNADIHGIFRLISNYSRWNIVAGDDVQGKVTVQMHDVPWDQAFQAILMSKGLGAQKFGNVVRVAPIETIKSEQQAALEAKRAQEELTELQMQVLPLNYTTASQMQMQIQDLVSTRGSVQVDNSGNQLIIHETEERIAQIRELVRQLDKATPQVLIEARVVEASSNFTRSLGIEWGAELNASTATGYSTGLFFPNSVGVAGGMSTSGGSQFYSAGEDNLLVDLGAEGSTGSLAFSLGSIPGLIDLDARLSAMEADGWGKVVSQPRITTLDNKPARISQGQKIPYLSTSSGGTRVQFIEASLELSVTPHITSDMKVFLSVELSNNRADFSQLVQGQPAIQVKEVSTEMLVADGDTTVLGGVFTTEESHSQDRVPGFAKIPLLGYLFKNSVEAITRNELLVFITPHVVTKASLANSG